MAGGSPLPGSDSPGEDALSADEHRAIDERIVDQAIDWYVRDASGLLTGEEGEQLSHWIATSPDHERAWQRLTGIGQQLRSPRQHVPARVAQATLARAAGIDPGRRRALKAFGWAAGGGAGAWLMRDQLPWQRVLDLALADVRTATGEIRHLDLADGTRLVLNTATAIEIDYSERLRRIVLRTGELLVETGSDPEGRALVVETRDGSLAPIGTRFTVRQTLPPGAANGDTLVAVNEGAVRVRPALALATAEPTREISAGWQLGFDRHKTGEAVRLRENNQAWTDGMLVAERQRLADLLVELDRYRPGRLRCAPEVADLRITGTWPLVGTDATDRILRSIERRLPVRIRQISRYWVVVGPASGAAPPGRRDQQDTAGLG